MSWNTPYTATAGTVLTAATWNVFVRDDLAYLKGMIDGTGSGSVTVPGDLRINNDANFRFEFASGIAARWLLDSGNDFFQFARNTNRFQFIVNSVEMLAFDSSGKLEGKGFYDSGEVTLAASATANLSHGLGAKPRYTHAYWSSTAGQVAGTANTALMTAPGAGVFISSASDTTIVMQNTAGGTRYGRVLAML